MRIQHVEIGDFRELEAVRIGFSAQKRVFFGANNSGKTSAMLPFGVRECPIISIRSALRFGVGKLYRPRQVRSGCSPSPFLALSHRGRAGA